MTTWLPAVLTVAAFLILIAAAAPRPDLRRLADPEPTATERARKDLAALDAALAGRGRVVASRYECGCVAYFGERFRVKECADHEWQRHAAGKAGTP